MSFFTELLNKHGLDYHDGRPLWQYSLIKEDFEILKTRIQKANLYLSFDPRDATLYYAEWWKFEYNGGTPSKKMIFLSLGKEQKYEDDHEQFFELARTGGSLLNISWHRNNNTFYFRSLLIQGGLPITHIENNSTNFSTFLHSVLAIQPECIEDFSFDEAITKILPVSSRNEVIYDISFKVVSCILKKDQQAIQDLVISFPTFTRIIDALIIKRETLGNAERTNQLKPQNFWILRRKANVYLIYLKLGIRPKYTKENLSNLFAIDVCNQEYQLFIDDSLISKFVRMLSGDYKTDIFPHQRIEWNGISAFPRSYLYSDGELIDLNNFIHTIPNLEEPSLWTQYSENEWRLIKGSNISSETGFLLYPDSWTCELESKEIELYDKKYYWVSFEGEVSLNFNGSKRKYLCGVDSFDWTISSEYPSWLKKSNLPVTRKKPVIFLYDESGNRINRNSYEVYYKKTGYDDDPWIKENHMRIVPIGIIDIKIEKDDVVVYDTIYNIGNFNLNFDYMTLQSTRIEVLNGNDFEFSLKSSTEFKFLMNRANHYSLELIQPIIKTPNSIQASISLNNQRKLNFEIDSPFRGLALIDNDGSIIRTKERLAVSNLMGLRILSKSGIEDTPEIVLSNNLKPYIKIIKRIKYSVYPIISLRDDINRLFSLVDIMNHENELSCIINAEGRTLEYTIGNFYYTLKQNDHDKHIVDIDNVEEELTLFGIPLNCSHSQIELIPLSSIEQDLDDRPLGYRTIRGSSELLNKTLHYKIPHDPISQHIIVFSTVDNDKRVLPRYVNIGDSDVELIKSERILKYHQELFDEGFKSESWLQLLSYFRICVDHDLPFSTLDQLMAITGSSKVASLAFFFLGTNSSDSDDFIHRIVPKIENDLGFDFHWINKKDWKDALNAAIILWGDDYTIGIFELLSKYFNESGFSEILHFINGESLGTADPILHPDLRDVRSNLGERVLNEIPKDGIPNVTSTYNLPIDRNEQIKLLLHAPIAVAESIIGLERDFDLFGGKLSKASIRRNIQYSRFLNMELYKKVILQVLKI